MRAHAVGPDLAYYVVKVGRVVDNEQPDAEVYQDERLSDAAAVDLLDEPEPLPV